MGFSIHGYVLEPPRIGRANSPFTAGPNNFVPQTLLPANGNAATNFTVTTGSPLVTYVGTSLVGILSAGQTIVFTVQVGVVYTVFSVSASTVVLTGVFTGIFSNPTATTAGYSPEIGPEVEAYNTAYPQSEANPRDDYLVLVTSELAPSVGTSFTIASIQAYNGLIECTVATGQIVSNGQTVIISGVNWSTGANVANGTWTVTVISSTPESVFVLNKSTFPLTGSYVAPLGTCLVVQGQPGLLTCAGFGWTKNEIVNRFGYDGRNGRFRTLPGGPIVIAGVLQTVAEGGQQQFKVPAPVEVLAAAPYRLSILPVGGFGSGTTQTVVLVTNDSDFTTPPPGTTQLSLATGNLYWNPADLNTNFKGQQVSFQQQAFFTITGSTGKIGTLTTLPATPTVLSTAIILNPLPATGQKPLIRIGYLYWMTTQEVPNEAAFLPPTSLTSGTVQWAVDTGRLNFSSIDIEANVGTNVYFDGTLFAKDVTLPSQNLGPMPSDGLMGPINTPVPATGDIIFYVRSNPANNTPYYQFPYYEVVGTPTTPPTGTVSILQQTGQVQFSSQDAGGYTGQDVFVVFGDLLIDHGVAIRFFRSPVNLNGQTTGVKDITAVYPVQAATWSSPIPAQPLVFLPSTPVDDDTLVISVNQGTGNFVGALNPVGVPTPLPGLGYLINFDTNQLNFAQRFDNVIVPLLIPAGYVQLPNALVLGTNAVVALESGTDTNVFLPQVVGVDVLIDTMAGFIYFVTTFGVLLEQSSSGTFSGTVFTDTSADFIVDNIQAGDFLMVLSDTNSKAQGMYTVVSVSSATSLIVDATPPVGSGELNYQILQGKEIMADRFFKTVTLVDPTTSVERIDALGPIANSHTIVSSGSATFPNQQTLSDPSTNFTTAGVLPGDTITLTSGPGIGTTYLVLMVATHTLTPTINFTQVAAATYTVTRRLQVPVQYVSSVRFRYGLPNATVPSGVFSTSVVLVNQDSNFSAPGTLPRGTVQISKATGNLNFAQVDVSTGGIVYVVRLLALGTDYNVNAGLGLIQFTSRMLTNEEVLLTYTTAPPSTTPPTPPAPPNRNERGTFLVRKELSQPHPNPTNTVTFDPTGKQVAGNPAPSVWRGGRPQFVNVGSPQNAGQIAINIVSQPPTITFLPDQQLLSQDIVNHGAILQPSENVYIDYYVYQAMGGEQTLTVLNPPMMVASVVIQEGTNAFLIAGDQRMVFPAGFILLVNNAEVYAIGTVTYDPVALYSTLTLSGTQEFQSDQQNPPLAVASGPTPLNAVLTTPAYFVMELSPFFTIARGQTQIFMPEDKTGVYVGNTVLYVTDNVGSFTDYYLVSSSSYNSTTNQTLITTTTATLRQYTYGQQIFYRSVRPIYGTAPTVVLTSLTPVTTPSSPPVTVIRRVTGQVGQILTSPVGYTIDTSGTVTYLSALQPDEEFSIFYTGYRTITWNGAATGLPGPRVQASYTATIVPDLANNGLLGQVLNANYTIFSPDNFYYRVETMTNFKLQVASEIASGAQSQGSSAGTGPMTSNTASPVLYQQGSPSIWFPPGDYANHDIIAQASLLYFNNCVNLLEDVLHAMDGRIVGDIDGRFLFDAVLGRYDYYSYDYNIPPQYPWLPVAPEPANIQNQIDDLIQIQPGPLPSYPNSLSYFQQAYVTGPVSRFYTTVRNIFTQNPIIVAPGTGDGSVIGAYNFNNLTSLPRYTFKRAPRAQLLFDYPFGQNAFYVDNTTGNGTLRPSWLVNNPPSQIIGMGVILLDQVGNYYVDESDNATVVAVTQPGPGTPGQITISSIPHTPAGPTGTPPSPPVSGPSQYAGGASILAVSGGIATVSVGANGIGPSAVGTQTLMLTGAASGPNNGTFLIVGINAQLGQIFINNPSAVANDLNNGVIQWTGAYPTFVPVGSTLTLSPIDTCVAQQEAQDVDSGASGTYGMYYEIGTDDDVAVDYKTGNVLYESPYWPFNGNSTFKLPTLFIPQSDYVIPTNNGDILEIDFAGVAATNLEPYQFPALFGFTTDDDGNQAIPIVGPTFDGEMTASGGGALYVETTAEAPGSVFRTQTTTPPYTSWDGSTAFLNGPRTRLTLTSGGAFPAPTPLLGSFGVTNGSVTVPTSSDQTGAVNPGDSVQFASQTSSNYTVLSVSSTELILTQAYTGPTDSPTIADSPLTGTFGVTRGTNSVTTTTNQTAHLSPGDVIQFGSQQFVNHTVLTVTWDAALSSGRVTLTTPYSGATNSATTASKILLGFFGVTMTSPTVTATTSQTGIISTGSKMQFASQAGTTYTVLSINGGGTIITLTTTYTGPTTTPTTATLIVATPVQYNLVRIVSGRNATSDSRWRRITSVSNAPPAFVDVASADAWPNSEPSGTNATITVALGIVTVTGLTGMTAAEVGGSLIISGSSQATNNGTWTIATFISATSVTITNGSAVTDTGGDTWSIGVAFAIAVSNASVPGLSTATLSGTSLMDASGHPFSGGPITMLGNTYGVMTFTANSSNTAVLSTIIPIVPATAPSADAKYWGNPDQSAAGDLFGSPISLGDIVSGPGISPTAIVTVMQIGPGNSITLSEPTTGGSQSAATFELQFTQPPPIAQTITGFSGMAASGTSSTGTAAITATGITAPPSVTITIPTSTPTIGPSNVGELITFMGGTHSGNNGTFEIVSFIAGSPPSITIVNPNAVASDSTLTWTIPPSPTISAITGGTSADSLAGLSIGDLVAGSNLNATCTIAEITNAGGGSFSLTLVSTNASGPIITPSITTTFSVTTRAPVTPWSTTVDSLTENFFQPTQPDLSGLAQAMMAGPLVISGLGITYSPQLVPPQVTTIATIVQTLATPFPPGPSFTLSEPATASTLTGSPLAYTNATKGPTIITIYVPYAAQPGWTVVLTSGANAGVRRQIVSITNTNTLVLDNAFPAGSSGSSYRIENSLNTYNGSVFQQLQSALATEESTISTRTAPTPPPYVWNQQSEQNALEGFFTQVFTTIISSSHGTISGPMPFMTLTDTTVHFIGPDPASPVVDSSFFVYIPLAVSGPDFENEGIYGIASVIDDHNLMVATAFPVSGTVNYQVVSSFGVSLTTLQNLFSILVANATFLTETQTFSTLLSTTVPVIYSGTVDPNSYANGVEDAQDDLGDRYTAVSNRLLYISPTATSGAQTFLTNALSTTDDLYAQRYSWINARINLVSGYLILQNSSLATVATNQKAVFNQLIQLLTIQSS